MAKKTLILAGLTFLVLACAVQRDQAPLDEEIKDESTARNEQQPILTVADALSPAPAPAQRNAPGKKSRSWAQSLGYAADLREQDRAFPMRSMTLNA